MIKWKELILINIKDICLCGVNHCFSTSVLRHIAYASDIDIYLTPLEQASQLIETCGM
jgi:hypothetical protein